MTDDVLYNIVVDLYARAVENGYAFRGWTSHDIADDMLTCTDELNAYDIDDIVPVLDTIRETTRIASVGQYVENVPEAVLKYMGDTNEA